MATGRAPQAAVGPVLRRADDTGGDGEGPEEGAGGLAPPALPPGISPSRAHLTVAVLCYINLLNYMDRFTVAGVLPDIEAFFGIGDSSSGLLQTVFISSYMLLAPVFGYLGDRHSRKRLLCLGIALWSAVTLASSFVPRERFWALLVARALVGVGEASYSTVAPTLIADLFAGAGRSRMLGCFYLAVPLGSGLGYIAGAKVKEAAADWHWALRVTPGVEDEAAAAEEAAEERGKPLSSPAEDNGYASSSLSIDSPDSVSGSAWEPPAAAHVRESPAEPGVADPGTETSPDTDALFPALAEAFQHIQDKERFKEREKEKHHIQLVMYRRLALLRWIHSLQQKVVAQQNRLQESFDTILDNRKELIRHLQQGLACPGAPGRPGL